MTSIIKRKFNFIAIVLLCFIIVAISVSCLLSFRYASDNVCFFETHNIDTYLKGGTHFEKTASLVLPSEELLLKNRIASYEFLHFSDKILRLEVIYNKDDFDSALKAVEEQYEKNDESVCEKFYFDNKLYHCFVFYNNSNDSANAYAMSYAVDMNENKISYMLYESFDLQVMNAVNALSIYYNTNSIVTVS